MFEKKKLALLIKDTPTKILTSLHVWGHYDVDIDLYGQLASLKALKNNLYSILILDTQNLNQILKETIKNDIPIIAPIKRDDLATKNIYPITSLSDTPTLLKYIAKIINTPNPTIDQLRPGPAFFPVPITYFYHVDFTTSPLFYQKPLGNGDYEKIIDANKIISPPQIKNLISSGLSELFIKRENYQDFLKNIQSNIKAKPQYK